MSSKLARLKGLKKSSLASPIKPKGGAMNGLEDAIIMDMAGGVTALGAIASAKGGSEWNEESVEIIPDVVVTASQPSAILIEMDGIELVEEMVNAAELVYPQVLVALSKETTKVFAGNPAHYLINKDIGEKYSKSDVIVAIVGKMLRVQGWKYLAKSKRWRSPIWLFPTMTVTWETMESMIREEIIEREESTLALPAPTETVEPVDDFADMPDVLANLGTASWSEPGHQSANLGLDLPNIDDLLGD